MKPIKTCLAVLLLYAATSAGAAVQNFPVHMRLAIIEDGRARYESRRQPTGFRMELISDSDGDKYETVSGGRHFVNAKNGESYSIRLYNPLPVRVAVNLTVDGLNSISGKPSGIADGRKWMIDPFSYTVIRGWQINGQESRRFFFTDKPKSYAKWRGDAMGANLAANCGVVGAAFFWSQQELNRYYEEHPVYRYSQGGTPAPAVARGPAQRKMAGESRDSLSGTPSGKPNEQPQQAGTGMGERESNPTMQVDFHYDTGMYSARQALLVYYDFAAPQPEPNPFPALTYAPEMPY